ncbi:RNI-like protein [Dentipellis sp. KUC8613]|nr:RNI-like protein [Dentipellis sp. KUC8613]
MASPTSSYAPSSSAVTIPTPGKSILKRPPPTPQSFLSRISKFLPNQASSQTTAEDEAKALKRAHFILPELVTVYPFSAANPPSTPNLKEEKKLVEQREQERRRRVLRGNSTGPDDTEEWWSLEKVESFYRECCMSRDDPPRPEVSAAFKNASSSNPRTVDFSGVQLTPMIAATLADVFTIEWGLRRLIFRECDLDERILKPILHALLIPGSITFISVASNRRLKTPAFRLIGSFVQQAKNLQFLDLSQNALDKKAIDYISVAFPQAGEQGLASLKLDDCFLKPAALDALAHVVRVSCLRNISLRHNRISATGAVAIALMIRDYPDVIPGVTPTSSAPSTPPMSPPPSVTALPSLQSATSTANSSPVNSPIAIHPRSGPLPPPPRHPTAAPQTTYTPYIPRSKRAAAANAAPNPLSPTGQQIPVITSSAQGGITMRHPAPPTPGGFSDHGPSAALLDKVRALDALPRLGALRTLDLRGNDIRSGITYIAQVLKRNRTLKVLNLSENKLDVQGLVAIAEALKYNSCLETLDLSKNPCCGPGFEGVQSLRTAFTLNTALKRLFLSSTSMTSAGAIALAEFLPESTSLLHLDLTMNNLDLAGVMALSSGLKGNHVMRCLDLNIPPGNEEMARMCRDILNTCSRNTEEAEAASGRAGKGVWGMLDDSELARTIRKEDEKVGSPSPPPVPAPETVLTASAPQSKHDSEGEAVVQARALKAELEGGVSEAALERARALLPALEEAAQVVSDPERLNDVLALNDYLRAAVARGAQAARPQIRLAGLGLDLGKGVGENGVANGHVEDAKEVESPEEDAEDELPPTPRVDKGKGRAEPEPEEPEPVLSPSFVRVAANEGEVEGEDGRSPTDRSKRWVAEEGEVFRKGTKLLGPEEMEGEYAGEDLRIELLEAMVERPPPRAILDDFGMEQASPERESSPPKPKAEEPAKPPPRPYIPRRTSSASIVSPIAKAAAAVLPSVKDNDSPQSGSPVSSSPGTPVSAAKPYVPRRKSSNGSLEARP